MRAPEGFMRDNARESVEAYAREIGVSNINLRVAEMGMAKAREKMLEKLKS